MSAQEIAKRHFTAALAEAAAELESPDTVARCMLNLVIETYLKTRAIKDVRSELQFVAENCDPDTDFMFMRP
jgi:hypothetical protein